MFDIWERFSAHLKPKFLLQKHPIGYASSTTLTRNSYQIQVQIQIQILIQFWFWYQI